MTQDLTKITAPFWLLDAETQEALRAHGGPYEWYHGRKLGWRDDDNPDYTFDNGGLVIRVKPQPPKPREWWIVKHKNASGLYLSAIIARAVADDHGGELIHVREVLE